MKKDKSKKEKLSEAVDWVLADYPALFGGDDTAARNDAKLFELLANNDEQLIALLAKNEVIRDKFFINAGNRTVVFKKEDFQFFVQENIAMHHGYTQYKNRIGLADGKKLISGSGDVVLNFPFKDCILEGGQSTEEGTDTYFEYEEQKTKKVKGKDVTQPAGFYQKQGKRAEIFFNSVIAADEIDMLLAPKALVNWKRYSKAGAKSVSGIARDADGTIKENLIIKGNNLLALHSIKKQFAGKVKLIYIDPPYNTGNDSFKYNDRFNHSTWLTFMKNRLEVARELLREDGVIFVQCDDNEQAYLKVLMDEVFGRDNFVNTVIHNNKYTTSNDAKFISSQHENIHIFAKSKNQWKINLLPRTKEMDASYKNPDNDPKGPWKATPLHAKSGTENHLYTITFDNGVSWSAPTGRYPRYSKENLNALYKSGEIFFNKKGGIDKKTYLSEVKKGKTAGSLWKYDEVGSTHQSNEEIAGLLGKGVFDSTKPEKLIQRILHLSTYEGDIVLDYHLGSATTAAVAHKMGRRYIGIEQMDYIETIAVERLKKVIGGEQGGISKSVDWKGGGDFVYCELAQWNQAAKEKILGCENLRSLIKFFDQMCDDYFLCHNVKIDNFKKIIKKKEKEFWKLSLAEQKKMFVAMLDNNQLYVSQSEMADSKFGISTADQNLTNQFYALEDK